MAQWRDRLLLAPTFADAPQAAMPHGALRRSDRIQAKGRGEILFGRHPWPFNSKRLFMNTPPPKLF